MLGQEKLGQVAPETTALVNGVPLIVGGEPPLPNDPRPRATFAGVRSSRAVRAGGFHWVPGSRGTNPNTAWPPRGVAVELDNVVDCASVAAGEGTLTVTLALELYDETSGPCPCSRSLNHALGRRVLLAGADGSVHGGDLPVDRLPSHHRHELSVSSWRRHALWTRALGLARWCRLRKLFPGGGATSSPLSNCATVCADLRAGFR